MWAWVVSEGVWVVSGSAEVASEGAWCERRGRGLQARIAGCERCGQVASEGGGLRAGAAGLRGLRAWVASEGAWVASGRALFWNFEIDLMAKRIFLPIYPQAYCPTFFLLVQSCLGSLCTGVIYDLKHYCWYF